MAGDTGSATVAASGTRRQITADLADTATVRARERILSIEITPRLENKGANMYFGTISVTTTYGKQIPKGTSWTKNYDPTTQPFNLLYMDADAGGDIADWAVVYQ